MYDPGVTALEPGRNPIRFYEYAFSSSVMIVVIALLVGIYEFGALIALFGVNAAMNLFGVSMENENRYTERTNWASFVYAIVPTLFVFFNIFALNMVLQYRKVGPWKNYLFGERMYIVLSLPAKTVLAWIIFSGTLAPA